MRAMAGSGFARVATLPPRLGADAMRPALVHALPFAPDDGGGGPKE
jgi:hypothetical protein